MRIYVFGNADLQSDSLPHKIVPALAKRFPNIQFIPTDPNELGLAPENPWWIMDTVKGIERVTLFKDPSRIRATRRVSVHDYDLGMHLALLGKVHKNLSLCIIGVPQGMKEAQAIEEVGKVLTSFSDAG
ncbi:MAG: hypothetical protein Q7S09_01830 [bacterium]|nr:hypothetical protein [bacterium]